MTDVGKAGAQSWYADEERACALALRIVCEDPTERDHLKDVVPGARRRLRAAASELVQAASAFLVAYLGRLLLDRSYKKVTAERGEVCRTERGVLALRRLLGRFYVRRLVGRGRLLQALGSIRRTDDEGNRIESLKLAERRYQAGDGFASGAAEHDSPLVRVILGVRVAGRSEPAWCIKRFVANGAGGWAPLHTGYEPDAESIMLDFYSEPSPAGYIRAAEPEGAQ